MKYRIASKISMAMSDDLILLSTKHLLRSQKARILKRESLRLFNPVIEFGDDGDDFIMNRKTLRATYDAFKVPRIVKNFLLKKK
jgi:hypothetical protein